MPRGIEGVVLAAGCSGSTAPSLRLTKLTYAERFATVQAVWRAG